MSIDVDYQFPPDIDPEKQAQVIAIGQTVGTWDARYADRETSLRSHLAEVINIRRQPDNSTATIRFPLHNVEGDVASLLTMIFGKYSMAGAAKVTAIRLPTDYGQFPKFGITGIRQLVNASDRPLIMAIFKPALGLSAADHASILADVAHAGLDVIKDDEIMADLDTAPTFKRLEACRAVLDDVKHKTGRTVLYAVNVTGKAYQLQEKARQLVAEGANALLLNVLTYGFSVLESLAADPTINVPIFAHPALAGALCAAPHHGFAYSAILGTLMAHAGADAVLYPAHYGNLPFEAAEEAQIRDALRSRNVFPVPSAGIHPGVIPKALRDYGHNVILNAGTGIMDHPSGSAAGVTAFRDGLERIRQGQSFQLADLPDGALKQAIAKWGC
jgi:2,3-diketo-5-methylthiopentyl-1-phosphate enolase